MEERFLAGPGAHRCRFRHAEPPGSARLRALTHREQSEERNPSRFDSGAREGPARGPSLLTRRLLV